MPNDRGLDRRLEDLVAMLEEMGVRTGIDLERLVDLGRLGEEILGRDLLSHVVKTGRVRQAH